MKLTYFALLLFCLTALLSCKKDKESIDIKTYDKQQIEAYIKANGFTNMKQLPNDTTGIYYEILSQGKGAAIDYPTLISYVYSVKSLDGQYSIGDTITNHGYNYAGLIVPKGMQIAIHDILKTKGTRAHVIIPSRLAYGSAGSGTGSGRLPGNVSLDYYINVIDDQAAYDDIAIQKFMSTYGLTGYIKILPTDPKFSAYAGMYYKINQAGDGTNIITGNSVVGFDYNLRLMNNTRIEYNATSADLGINSVIGGVKGGLLIGGSLNANLSVIFPSRLGYGTGQPGPETSLPHNSCLYYDLNITAVSK